MEILVWLLAPAGFVAAFRVLWLMGGARLAYRKGKLTATGYRGLMYWAGLNTISILIFVTFLLRWQSLRTC